MLPGTFRNLVRSRLESAGLENAGQESLWLCAAAKGISPAEYSVSTEELSPGTVSLAESYADRRMNGEPIQYILGSEFFGELEFLVGPGVLIPRPETYFLVDYAVACLPWGGCFFEIGTGSGAVALSVASRRRDVSVSASELSPEALKWAEKNREKLGCSRADLREGSFFEPFPPEMKFDCVAANLPYIPREMRSSLQREVRDFEPGTALFADDSGMAAVKTALELLPSRLLPGGTAVFEAGCEQIEPLKVFAGDLFPKVSEACDLYGNPRFLIIET